VRLAVLGAVPAGQYVSTRWAEDWRPGHVVDPSTSVTTQYDRAVTSLDDLDRRLHIVEAEVARMREQAAITSSDAAAARVLAGGADRDVSEVRAELRAHTQALNALRETQLEQAQKMSDGFTTLIVGIAQMTNLLQKISESNDD